MTRLSVGVIGAGRVGAVLAAALRASGHDLVAVSGTSPASHTRIETMLTGTRVLPPAEVASGAQLLLLTVPDDALVGLVESLVADGAIHAGQTLVHTSGRHGTSVLSAASAVGVKVIAMHPAMTFTGTDIDVERLRGAVFALTAAPSEKAAAEELVAELGGSPMWIAEDQRALYHAALAHGANHLVTLVSQSMGLLREMGAADPSAVLRPLLGAALDNALAYGDAALTGPVVRGDVSTVRAHVDALADAPSTTLDAYVEMARATTAHSVAAGRLTPSRARDLTRVLDEAGWDSLAQLVPGLR